MTEWVLPLASVILGGGFLGGIVLLLKVRPEAGSVAVMASEKVVVLQMGTITRLEEELGELRSLAHEVHALRDKQASLQRQFDQVVSEKADLATENTKLLGRVAHLASENTTLLTRVANLEDEVAQLKSRPETTRTRSDDA